MKNNLILFLLTCLNVAAFGNDLTIRNFRFAHHNALDFERLVIEFRATEADAKPGVKLNILEKEAQIQLRGAQLVGGIPEAAINDSYKNSSKYFGPLSINTDSPDGHVLLRAFTKKSHSKVDAFWLNNPPRLIVDVFPQESERSFGREVVGNREFASTGGHRKSHEESGHHRASKSAGGVVCYPANAQVKPSIGFDRYAKAPELLMGDEETRNNQMGNILCFTVSSQVIPSISFHPGQSTSSSFFQGNFEEKVKTFTPPKAAQRKQVAVERPLPVDPMNLEADEMMGMGNDDGPPPRSPSATINYNDGFNKNNPPPTLGKNLLPPIEAGGSGQKSSNQGANPATLLPPLK